MVAGLATSVLTPLGYLLYLAAFALFSSIYHHQLRTLYAAPLVFVAAAMLAYEILNRVRQRSHSLPAGTAYAGIIQSR